MVTPRSDLPGTGPLRLGVVSYLNAEPLVYGLDGDPGFELLRDVPSRVAERLHAGEVHLGMIPSIEYPRGDYAVVPGIAITSRGPVRSVRLLLQRPIEHVRRVALDRSSRTSQALLKVLLRERLGRDPEYVQMPPEPAAMLASADAALLIGDPALYLDLPGEPIDLGEEWTRITGLPFVYAFWAGPVGAIDAAGVRRLQAALHQGLLGLGRIAAVYNGLGAGHAARSEAYLRTNIVYRLEDDELRGLREFYRRACALGLIPRQPELRFHGHP
jgi:chorismate dehydratase